MSFQQAVKRFIATFDISKTTAIQSWIHLKGAFSSNDGHAESFEQWIIQQNQIPADVIEAMAQMLYGKHHALQKPDIKKEIEKLTTRLELRGNGILYLALGCTVLASRRALEIMNRIIRRNEDVSIDGVLPYLIQARNSRGGNTFTLDDMRRAEAAMTESKAAKENLKQDKVIEDGVSPRVDDGNENNTDLDDDDDDDDVRNDEYWLKRKPPNSDINESEWYGSNGRTPSVDSTSNGRRSNSPRSPEIARHASPSPLQPMSRFNSEPRARIAVQSPYQSSPFSLQFGQSNLSSRSNHQDTVGVGSEKSFKVQFDYPISLPLEVDAAFNDKAIPSHTFPIQRESRDSLLGNQGTSTPDLKTWGNAELCTGKLVLKAKDISTLDDVKWLNDEVINAVVEIIVKQFSDQVYGFSSFFFKNLAGTHLSNLSFNYEKVERYTSKVDIFAIGCAAVPIHLEGNHWSLAILTRLNSLRNGESPVVITMDNLDSQGDKNRPIFDVLANYISAEAQNKLEVKLDTADIVWKHARDVPSMNFMNTWDCGIWLLYNLVRFLQNPQKCMELMDSISESVNCNEQSQHARIWIRRYLLGLLDQQPRQSCPVVPHTFPPFDFGSRSSGSAPVNLAPARSPSVSVIKSPKSFDAPSQQFLENALEKPFEQKISPDSGKDRCPGSSKNTKDDAQNTVEESSIINIAATTSLNSTSALHEILNNVDIRSRCRKLQRTHQDTPSGFDKGMFYDRSPEMSRAYREKSVWEDPESILDIIEDADLRPESNKSDLGLSTRAGHDPDSDPLQGQDWPNGGDASPNGQTKTINALSSSDEMTPVCDGTIMVTVHDCLCIFFKDYATISSPDISGVEEQVCKVHYDRAILDETIDTVEARAMLGYFDENQIRSRLPISPSPKGNKPARSRSKRKLGSMLHHEITAHQEFLRYKSNKQKELKLATSLLGVLKACHADKSYIEARYEDHYKSNHQYRSAEELTQDREGLAKETDYHNAYFDSLIEDENARVQTLQKRVQQGVKLAFQAMGIVQVIVDWLCDDLKNAEECIQDVLEGFESFRADLQEALRV